MSMKENSIFKLSSNIEIQKKYGLDGANQSTFTSNIYDERQTVSKLRSSFEILSNTVGKTLGPYGSTILLESHDDFPLISKDGKDVFDHIRFNDSVANVVWSIIKRSISVQARGVGDGTTSAVVVANKLYQNFMDALADKNSNISKCAPKDLIDINKFIVSKLVESINDSAFKVSDDLREIEQIATVSFNNDKEVGKFIKDVYLKTGEDGYVTTDINPFNHVDNRVTYVKGFELEGAQPVSKEYLNFFDAVNEKIVYDNHPLIFMADGTLTTPLINSFLNIILPRYVIAQKGSKPHDIVFIANDYDKNVKEFLLGFRKRIATPFQRGMDNVEIGSFTVLDFSLLNPEKKLMFYDLATAVGAKVFDPSKERPIDIMKNEGLYFGVAERVEITQYSTKITTLDDSYFKENNKQYVIDAKEELVMNIRNTIAELESSSIEDDEEQMGLIVSKRRLTRFTNYSSAVINPGGYTFDDRISSERLFEDAILSSKNAMKYGYIHGGFLTAPKLLKQKEFRENLIEETKERFPWIDNIAKTEELISEFIGLLEDSYLEIYRKVLRNANILDDDINDIIDRCLSEGLFYNVKERDFKNQTENTIINPVNLDTEILNTISNIIMLLINTPMVVSRGSNRTEERQQYL